MNQNENNDDYVFTCLHCDEPFIIHHNDFNCKILRHGVYKHNLQPINPHATKSECETLVSSGQIYGCAGPLMITKSPGNGGSSDRSGGYALTICEYI